MTTHAGASAVTLIGPRPRVIFVNRFFHPDHSATSQILSDLAFALAARGWPVEVFTSRQIYDQRKEQLPPNEVVHGVRIKRIPTTRFGRRVLAGRAVDYLTFYASVAAVLTRSLRRGDIVVAKTDPPVLSVIAAPIARMRGATLVNWLQDVFPEVFEAIVSPPTITRTGLTALKWLRDCSLKSARLNVVIGERMAGVIATRGVTARSIRCIPNWADGAVINPVAPADNPLRRAWGLSDKFVVSYSGNFGRAHDASTILSAMAILERRVSLMPGPPVHWLFIGGGASLELLRQEVVRRSLTKIVQLRPYQSRENLALSLGCADVHLASLRPQLEGLIVPSKFYGIAAAGRACIFIGDVDGEIARSVKLAGCGYVVSEGDGAGLARAIQELQSQDGLAKAMGRAARRHFEEKRTLTAAVDAWERALNDLAVSR